MTGLVPDYPVPPRWTTSTRMASLAASETRRDERLEDSTGLASPCRLGSRALRLLPLFFRFAHFGTRLLAI